MSGSCKKANRNKNSTSSMVRKAQLRWERNKKRRIAKEASRQSWCRKARAAAEAAGENPKSVRDVSRRVRILKRSA